MAALLRIIAYLVLLQIKAYQYIISPLLGRRCRFHPSCSEYAIQAIEKFGILKGAYLTIRRLLKCHPLHPGGCDPVPDTIKKIRQ